MSLPSPDTIDKIKELLNSKKIENPNIFNLDRYLIDRKVDPILSSLDLEKNTVLIPDINSQDATLLDIYSLCRSHNQLNEACNKLWATIELAYVVSPGIKEKYNYCLLGENFNRDFLLGKLIPTLYYSQISAIISILSSFGCISLHYYIQDKNIFYNLVRTHDGWKIYERKKYLTLFSKNPSKSWHSQIIQILEIFLNKIRDFPRIDYSETHKLSILRNKTHYGILGSVSASQVMGIQKYFEYLPLVVNTIIMSSELLKKFSEYTPYFDYETRFKNLITNLPNLYQFYKMEYPSERFLITRNNL